MRAGSIEQVVGELRGALKGMRRGQVELVVVKEDGVVAYELRRSRLTTEDWERLMTERPKGVRR